MKERLRQFMLGRHGMDSLGQAMNIAAIILLLLGIWIPLLETLAFALVIYSIFRMMSRNTIRRSAENEAFSSWIGRIKAKLGTLKRRFAERKTHIFLALRKIWLKVV